MDFFKIKQRATKKGYIEIYADYIYARCKDLMIRGGEFYGMWDDKRKLWIEDELEIASVIDDRLYDAMETLQKENPEQKFGIRGLRMSSTEGWNDWKRFIKDLPDMYKQMNSKLVFADDAYIREDLSTKRLPYTLAPGNMDSYEEIISTLYDPAERDKIEWAIGCVLAGDISKIQKFFVFYGAPGTGKSTIINIIQQLFAGYYTSFKASELTSRSNSFPLQAFANNPMIAIQHDGDLSKIEDNTTLNSIASHEEMSVNEKYKTAYTMKLNCLLIMGTNSVVRITDSKSGVIRRLIDIQPSRRKIEENRYYVLTDNVEYELGAIAHHCLQKYRQMGRSYYGAYKPVEMMGKSDTFFNFIDENIEDFSRLPYLTVTRAYELYKKYCENAMVAYPLPMIKFKEEIKEYFEEFHDRKYDPASGKQLRGVLVGLRLEKFKGFEAPEIDTKADSRISLTLDQTESLLDEMLKDCPAQNTTPEGFPITKWDNNKHILSDIDTTTLHFVQPPENHIVVDFDMKDEQGNKSQEQNLIAASKWPATYAEYSKSGGGVHLHYIYTGDINKLSRVFGPDIEIKVFTGNSSLRRKLSKCNDIPVTTLSSGLPLKEEKMISNDVIQNEKHLRAMIEKNLRKEIHCGTKPSVDFIHKILTDAYNSGVSYDVTDMRELVFSFALNSSNQSDYCIKLVNEMHFKSAEISDGEEMVDDRPLTFYDVEVFPNLFVVCLVDDNKEVATSWINPTPEEVGEILKLKLVGFNNRRYDNHIMYARYLGYSNEALYELSQRIVTENDGLFGEAYNLSHTDVYDFASAGHKMSLKKWELKLGIHHLELGLPWDKPVDPKMWNKVAEYCCNDVYATKAVFHKIYGDYVARCILADITGLTPNHTTNALSTAFVFEGNKTPQDQFIYTDLSEMFPGYEFDKFKKESIYRGFKVGEGGFVYSKPGMYGNVALIDVASMHPSSLIAMNMFGDYYTNRFKEIKDTRVDIKRKDLDTARTRLNGQVAKYLNDPENLKGLPDALKTVINSGYGLTSASFANPWKDPRNIDNIVAKRGALFMIDLYYAVTEEGYEVVHIKTDSIKIADADDYIIDFCMKFAEKYQYEFEHEATYDKLCLVNKAVYIARYKGGSNDGLWTVTGSQFAHPYVLEKLIGHKRLPEYVAKDMGLTNGLGDYTILAETKQVKGAMYLRKGDFEEFVGKCGAFLPVKDGYELFKRDGEREGAVTGCKGYQWMDVEVYKGCMSKPLSLPEIDWTYYENLYNDACKAIEEYGDLGWFTSDRYYSKEDNEILPF